MVLKGLPHYFLLTFYAYMLLQYLVACGHCAEILQTLYFTNDIVDLGGGSPSYLMNGSTINSGSPSESVEAFFVSLPLAANHQFTNLTVTINHTSVASVDSRVYIRIGGWDSNLNQSYPSHENDDFVNMDSTWISFSFATNCCGINIFEHDRLWIHLRCEGEGLKLVWGNTTYNGGVSFDGVVEFVPEFPAAIFLAFFIALSIITIVHQRNAIRR